MSTAIDFFFCHYFFYPDNVIFTSYTIKNIINPDNPNISTQPVTRDIDGGRLSGLVLKAR